MTKYQNPRLKAELMVDHEMDIIVDLLAAQIERADIAEERAGRYKEALRKEPEWLDREREEGDCFFDCGGYRPAGYHNGEPHKPDCPRVTMPEVWEEKA